MKIKTFVCLLSLVLFRNLQALASPLQLFWPAETQNMIPVNTLDIIKADMNNDGIDDYVLLSTQNGGQITTLIFDSFGNYTPVATNGYTISNLSGLTHIVAADVNSDGFKDIIGTNSGSIYIFLGTGTGTITGTFASINIPGGNTSLSFIHVADLNHDSIPDFIINDQSKLYAYLGYGNGTFHPAITTNLVAGLKDFGIADINNDGNLDILITNFNNQNIISLLGNGLGNFTNVGSYSVGGTAGISTPNSLEIKDFNQDGFQDAAVSAANGISILMGTGTGSFGPANFINFGQVNVTAILAGDFDHDGLIDLATPGNYQATSANNITILRNFPAGQFTVTSSFPASYTYPMNKFLLGDPNGDNDLDLLCLFSTNSFLTRIIGNGDGTFGHYTDVPAPFSFTTQSIAGGDFNNDGFPDVAVTTSATPTGRIYTMLNNGNLTFSYVNSGLLLDGYIAKTADFNNDGILDIALWVNNSLKILLGNGSGGFTDPNLIIPGVNSKNIVVGNFNGDNNLDVAYIGIGNTIGVTFGTGSGTFSGTTFYTIANNISDIKSADFNNDQILDLAVTNINYFPTSPTLTILNGNGTGIFSIANTINLGTFQPIAMTINDFNTDGLADIAMVASGQSLKVFLGIGNNSFQPPSSFTIGGAVNVYSAGILSDDFNNDGFVDIAIANTTTVLLGNGSGSFTPFLFGTGSGSLSLFSADLNTDGRTDLVFTTNPMYNPMYTASAFSYLLNNYSPISVNLIKNTTPAHPGGTLNYTIKGVNNTSQPQNFIATIYIVLPGSPIKYPIETFYNVTFPGGTALNVPYFLNIPNNAPLWNFKLGMQVQSSSTPYTIWDSDEFNFLVQ